MRNFLKPALMALLLAGSAVATVSSASAHDYNGGYDQSYGNRDYRSYGNGDYRDHGSWHSRDRGRGDWYRHDRFEHSHYRGYDRHDWRDHRYGD